MASLEGKFAVCIGATAGIGKAVAVRLAQLQANVTVIGRNAEAGALVLEELNKANPKGKHGVIIADASSMKSIVKGCSDFLMQNNSPLHYCVLSQGIASLAGRTETSDGIDQKLSLHYYGRILFLRHLSERMKRTALQPQNNDVRVLNILSGGVHSAYTDLDDLDLKKNFTLANAANAAGFYNDLAMDQMSRDTDYLNAIPDTDNTKSKRGISFIHAAPGFVRTTWGKDFPVYLTLPLRFAQLFAKSPEECASLMVQHGLLSAERQGQGFHIMGENGQVASPTKDHTDLYREKVWQHTNELLTKALNT